MHAQNIGVAIGIYFTSFFSLIGGLGAALTPSHKSEKPALSLLLFFTGGWLFWGACAAIGLKDVIPFNIFSAGFVCSSFLVPFPYLNFLASTNNLFRLRLRHIPHFFCPVISIFYAMYLISNFDAIYRKTPFTEFYYNPPGSALFSLILYMPSIALIIELCLIFYRTVKISRSDSSTFNSSILTAIVVVFLNLFQSILWIVDRAFSLGFIWYLYLLSGAFPILAFLITKGNPQIFQSMNSKSRQDIHTKTRLKDIDVAKAIENIDIVMRQEKIYRRDNLNLNVLAVKVKLSPHQLSELINKHLEKNFNSLINFYRIEEAKELLIREKDKLIVDIGFEVGFNSSSSFYRIFQNEVGTSPTLYRKEKGRVPKKK